MTTNEPHGFLQTIFWPPIDVWRRYNPIGRCFVLPVAVLAMLAIWGLMIAMTPVILCVAFGEWLDQTRFAKRISAFFANLFLKKK